MARLWPRIHTFSQPILLNPINDPVKVILSNSLAVAFEQCHSRQSSLGHRTKRATVFLSEEVERQRAGDSLDSPIPTVHS